MGVAAAAAAAPAVAANQNGCMAGVLAITDAGTHAITRPTHAPTHAHTRDGHEGLVGHAVPSRAVPCRAVQQAQLENPAAWLSHTHEGTQTGQLPLSNQDQALTPTATPTATTKTIKWQPVLAHRPTCQEDDALNALPQHCSSSQDEDRPAVGLVHAALCCIGIATRLRLLKSLHRETRGGTAGTCLGVQAQRLVMLEGHCSHH